MKDLKWVGNSYTVLKAFPRAAQYAIGNELRAVQQGFQPNDFKPMPTTGKGVEEIRVWVESGTYRVVYIARLEEAVYVLHTFQKKSQQTSQRDLTLARVRLERLLKERKK